MKRLMMLLAVAGTFLAPPVFTQQMVIVRAWPDSLNVYQGRSLNNWDLLVAKNGDVFTATVSVGSIPIPGPIWRTTDDGKTWKNLWNGGTNGLTSTEGFGICQDPASDAILLGTWNGIYRSTDNGETWTQPPVPAPYQTWKAIVRFAVSKDGAVFTGSKSGVIVSSDGGRNWSTAFYDSTKNFWTRDVCVAPNGTIFVATEGQGILRSTDGKIWAYANSGLGSVKLSTVACDNNGTAYAGTFGSEGLYRSTDNGETWQNIGFVNNSVDDILVIWPDLIFVATIPAGAPGGVFKGNGTSWQKIGPEPIDGMSLALKGDDLWIGTRDGVWLATDILTAVADNYQLPITDYRLLQNYPNPFNPSTTIEFALPTRAFVTLKVMNLIGQEVAVLVSSELPAGSHRVQWDASAFPSGIYFYRLETKNFVQTKKMLLVK